MTIAALESNWGRAYIKEILEALRELTLTQSRDDRDKVANKIIQ